MKKRLEVTDIEVIQTTDRSFTFIQKEGNVSYRSVHGADTESKHVFIQGSRITEKENWKVLELGFGLGTNFKNLLAARKNQSMHYISLEFQPLPPELIQGEDLASKMIRDVLQKARKTNETVVVSQERIRLELVPQNIFQAEVPANWANACFHDPFGPKENPEAWSKECFEILYHSLADDGILSTYGAAGHAKRAMVAAGFWIASGVGYGKKREITYGAKMPEYLQHGELNRKYQPKQ